MAAAATDTIAAIATPPGPGGVGIVRVSGPEALFVLRRVFRPRRSICEFKSHHLYYGHILGPDDTPLDEALAVFMRGPKSYTGEDVAEFQCHAAPVVLQELLEHLFTLGARPAEPGEFTKRAYLAGRIDLTRAEAVIELIEAQTGAGARLAAAGLGGALSGEIAAIREAVVELLARLEVAIDFPEDDVDIFDREEAARTLRERVLEPVEGLIAGADQGRLFREGARLVIAGLPNAGKSSLLNALLQEDRALVTPHPGTTRDSIEEAIDLFGIPLRLVDTAGIRDSGDDPVEALGVARAREMIETADGVLYLVDAQAGFTAADRDLLEHIACPRQILALNKRDLIRPEREAALREKLAETGRPVAAISARTGDGLDELRREIARLVAPEREQLADTARVAPNRRHRALLVQTRAACEACLESLAAKAPLDLLAVDAQSILAPLADIDGTDSPDEVLDAVFSRFCIGK